ncbi:rhomboid family intramembrane serine protease [Cryobacterium sp. CG_9.6]|uniref:rhomboid family intramembrane serine protease n=1 Tax=Cryobacterium sp. CG_9.6 TaxID=2760710 RepID=UPI00247E5D13|nr:membrane associated rhomboid family serine protease [Cryobacterium sp. CG_9.6]
MKEQRKNAPRTKPALLTRLTGAGRPTVTYALIAVTVFVFVLQWIPGLNIYQNFAYMPALTVFEPWRMITSVFLHSQGFIFHILLNMYMLWIFGPILEDLLGRIRFLALYLVSGFAGSLGVLLLSSPTTVVVGASGAIFGLLGAYLVIQRRLGGNSTQLLVLLGINFVIGFIPGLNIAWQAHLGGLIGGALMGLIFVQTRRLKHQALQIPLVAALVLGLAAVTALVVL